MKKPLFDIPCLDEVRVRSRFAASPSHQNVLICFSGVNKQMGGMAMQKPEFFQAGQSFDNMLFIDDVTRSWGNHIDFAKMFARLAPFLEGRRVCMLGNSMGGTNAIIASNYINVDIVLAVVPRFTVLPEYDLPDGEHRPYLEDIREWKYPTIWDQFNERTSYKVISGSSKTEKCHTDLFPVQDNLSHYVLKPSNHGLAFGLKKIGVLPDMIAGAWDGRLNAAWLAKLTGKRIEVLSGPELGRTKRLRAS